MLKHFILPFLILVTSCATTTPNKLEAKIIKSQNSIVKDNCDILWFERKIKILNVLKANEKRIKNVTVSEEYSEEGFTIIPFGPIIIREPTIEASPVDKWSEYSTDWTTIYKFYQTIQTKPVSNDWIELSRAAQSLIMNDERRLTRFYNFNLTEKSYSKLIELQSILTMCMSDKACNDLKLSKDQISFLNETPLYSYFYSKYLGSSSSEQKKTRLQKFYNGSNSILKADFLFQKIRKL